MFYDARADIRGRRETLAPRTPNVLKTFGDYRGRYKTAIRPPLSDDRSVYNAVTQDSTIGQKAEVATKTYNAAAMQAPQTDATNNTQGIAKAQLDAVNAMSDFDRKVLFQTTINDNYSGSKYTGESQWLSALQDQASGNTAMASYRGS